MRIGIFDSGIGGINVLKELMKAYPEEEYIYYGDTLHLPYGEKTKEELIRLGSAIIHFFEQESVDIIVIACGTCSSLVEEYRKVTCIPIYDVITPTVEYIKNHYHVVALLATSATIKNGLFQKKLETNGIKVEPKSCPSFVPYLEGLTQEPLRIELELEPLLSKKMEAVILGCTHYPLLKEKIEAFLKVPCIDMGSCLAEQLIMSSKSSFSLTVYMSKITPGLKENVEKILNLKIALIEKIVSE